MVLSVLGCGKESAPKDTDDTDKLTVTDGTGCKLPKRSPDYELGLGFPHDPNRQRTTGTVKVAVIFVDFSDAAATRSPQEVFNLLSPASETFISTVSHAKLQVVFAPKFKWYRMSKPSTGYGWNHLTFDLHKVYIREAVNLADADYDFSQTDEIVVVSNPYGGVFANGPTFIGSPGNGIFADGHTILNAVTTGKDLLVFRGLWFPHEFGHSMGLPDLYAYAGPLHGYVGDFSLMGNILGTAPTYNAWEQWEFGWVDDSQVSCAKGKGTGTQQLSPVEGRDGTKLLVLPIDVTTAVIVEDRRASGYDSPVEKEGPLVYLIDTRISNGQGGLKVLPGNINDQSKRDAPLSIGQQITYKNITVKCTASAIGGSTVTYERK